MHNRHAAAPLRRKTLAAFIERRIVSLAGAALLGVGTVSSVLAATIVVNSAADPGDAGTCTLRQAITSMNTGAVSGTACVNTGNAFGAYDTINFDTGVFPVGGTNTVTLAGSPLQVTDSNLTIDAAANRQVTIDASRKSRVFFLGDIGVTASVTLNYLQVRNGIANDNTFTWPGGGIFALYSNLVLNHSAVTGCDSKGKYGLGGGIGVVNGTLTVNRSTISGNHSDQGGGAIRGLNSQITIKYSTLAYNAGGQGLVGASPSTSYQGYGGAIYTKNTPLTVTSSTISGNVAHGQGALRNVGSGSLTFRNVTLAGNRNVYANRSLISSGSAPIGIYNTLMADNGTQLGADPGVVISGTNNLLTGTVSGATFATLPLVGDAKLAALADNGGPTPTRLPGPGSAAIDASSSCAGTDQRGIARPQGAACDIGAVEIRPRTLGVTVTGSGSVSSSTVAIPPTSNGIVGCSSGTCSANFAEGATVTLVGTPAAGLHVVWSGDCAANGTVIMTANRSCTATFTQPTVLPTVILAINAAGDAILDHDPVYGEELHMHAYVAGPSGMPPPEGLVTFFDATSGGFAPLCAGRTLDTGGGTWDHGWAWCVPDGNWIPGAQHVQAGQRQLKVTYDGEGIYFEAMSGAYPLNVLPAVSTTAIASQTPNPVEAGSQFSVVAQVALNAPSAATPQGIVKIDDQTAGISCTYDLSSATPGCALTPVSFGTHSLLVTYLGNQNIIGSSASTTQVVLERPIFRNGFE